MPLTANEASAAPDRRDEPLPFDLSGISLDLDQPVGRPTSTTRRPATCSTTAAAARIRSRASSSWPRSSSASATRTARAICYARCSPRRAARPRPKRRACSTGSAEARGARRARLVRTELPSRVVRVALGIAYRGSAYSGWQSQPGGRTVQDQLDQALSAFVDAPLKSICAGRTDAGVHALNQVVHLDSPVVRDADSWVRGINRYLPGDIAVQWCRFVPDSLPFTRQRARATLRLPASRGAGAPGGRNGFGRMDVSKARRRCDATGGARPCRQARLQRLPIRRMPGPVTGQDDAHSPPSSGAAPLALRTSRPTPFCTT